MKLEEIITVSSYLDGASEEPLKLELLLQGRPDLKKVLQGFRFISDALISAYPQINTPEVSADEFWAGLEGRLQSEDQVLDSILTESFTVLPSELAEQDIWPIVEAKLDTNDELAKVTDLATFSRTRTTTQAVNLSGALLANFKVPARFANIDVWEEVTKKLDQDLHAELFSESASISQSDKEKFFLGLSEYLDGECSTSKMQSVNEHLLECSTCRNYYLSLLKVRNAVKHAHKTAHQLDHEDFWVSLSDALFPEDRQKAYLQAEGF